MSSHHHERTTTGAGPTPASKRWTFGELVRGDFRHAAVVFSKGSPEPKNSAALTHLFPHVFVAVAYRVAQALERRGGVWRIPGHLVSVVCFALTGAEIRPTADIGPGFVVVHPSGIVIGGEVVAGQRLVMFGKNTLGRVRGPGHPKAGSPVIGDDVIVGISSSIVGPVTVGDGALIGAHCLVADDVPAGGFTRSQTAIVEAGGATGGVSGIRGAGVGQGSRTAS